MKKLFLMQLIAFSIIALNAQSWTSSNLISSSDGDVTVIESVSDSQSNTIVFGFFTGTLTSGSESIRSNGGRDLFICKFDSNSTVLWLRNLGGDINDDLDGGICTDSEDNIYISSAFQNVLKHSENDSIQSLGSFDILLAKYEPNGSLQWIRNAGSGINQQRSTALNLNSNGELILGGYFIDSVSFYTDSTIISTSDFYEYFYASFDPSNGDFLWAKPIKVISGVIGGRINGIISGQDYMLFTGIFSDSIIVGDDTIVSTNNSIDTHLIKADLNGNIEWVRKVGGSDVDFSYTSIVDDDDDIYFTGYYSSPSITVDSTDIDEIVIERNLGSYDIFIAKYTLDGTLVWFRTSGGKGSDKVADAEFFNGEVNLSGLFSDTLYWGGISLSTTGVNDQDMFIAAIDTDGNFRSANSTSGRKGSKEDALSILHDGSYLFTVISSNSDLLILGDSIYTSSGDYFYIALGIQGCLPISIDNVITQDVQTCYGDSTGSIQILTSGGFGAPWQYSIDNGLSYKDLAYFGDLPTGDYPIVVIDAENCAQTGPMETVSQPDTLMIEYTYKDISPDEDGEIVVAASGGTAPYTYTLQPGGVVQGFGTYTFKPGEEGEYIVEVNDSRSCGPVSTDTIAIIVLSDGVDLSELGVNLYPNPSSGVITLEMPFDGDECTLEVLSLTGQVMLSRQVYSNGGVINEKIDMSALSKGMYMIRIDGQTLRSGVVLN